MKPKNEIISRITSATKTHKRTTVLYTRVSTDEQNNGYSPADQKAKLIKYCEQNNIEIAAFYHDDESAESFERPQWKNLMQYIKKSRGSVDSILFVKWDRYSRNVAEAYITRRELLRYGVEPQAIEQPLDFDVPESKIMLAIYLAAPEVDNDRRRLNTFNGMRRAKIAGRWLGTALKGYKNSRDENNRPIMVPEGGKTEELVKTAFTLFATGLYPIDELRRKMNREGLKLSRNAFWGMLRNKGYIGKVFVPAYKDEPAEWVNGQHKSIIAEGLFYTVQDLLNERKKSSPSKYQTAREEIPLRGHLICPRCGRTLTGSASTGRKGSKFFYYHCSNGCKERQKAGEINQQFGNLLSSLKVNTESIQLYGEVLKNILNQTNVANRLQVQELNKEAAKQAQRLKNARALMLDGEIKPDEYKEMKVEIESEHSKILAKINQLKEGSEDFDGVITYCVGLLQNIDAFYNTASTEVKQRIIGSVFPEKLMFENSKCRTTKINEVVALICNGGKGLQPSEIEKHTFLSVLSCRVARTGLKFPMLTEELCSVKPLSILGFREFLCLCGFRRK